MPAIGCHLTAIAAGAECLAAHSARPYNQSSIIMCLLRSSRTGVCSSHTVDKTRLCRDQTLSVESHRLPWLLVCLIRVLLKGVLPPLAQESMSSVQAVPSHIGRCVEDSVDAFAPPSVQLATTQTHRCGSRSASLEKRPSHRHQVAAMAASLGTPADLHNSGHRAVRRANCGKSFPALGHHPAMHLVIRTCAILTACSSFWVQCLDPEQNARLGNTDRCKARMVTLLWHAKGVICCGRFPCGVNGLSEFLVVPRA